MGDTRAEVSAAHVGCPISNKVGLTPGFNRLSSRINASSFQLSSRLTPKKWLPLFSNKVFLPCHCLNIRRNDILIPHKLPVSSSTWSIFNFALKSFCLQKLLDFIRFSAQTLTFHRVNTSVCVIMQTVCAKH